LNKLLLRDSVVLGLRVAGDAAVAVDGGGNLFSSRGVAGGSAACGCSRCWCDGRRRWSGVNSLGLAATAGDGGTLVRGRESFVGGDDGTLHRGVTGAVGLTFTFRFPGFCRRLP
jgi:hypothetical protein